jgi:molybdopterin converting factor small subunit
MFGWELSSSASLETHMDGTADTSTRTARAEQTSIEVRATGHVRDVVGTGRLDYTFEGSTLREFLEAFFAEYDVRDLLIAETEADATAHGWATPPADLPGTWRKNPEGEQTRAFARVLVNGKFNEHLDGLDTVLRDGDRVALVKPFVFCV